MNEEKANTLYKKYPKILSNVYFEIGDGWYDIIDTLCFQIQNHIDWSRQQKARVLLINRAIKSSQKGNDWLMKKLYEPNYAARLIRGGIQEVPEACGQVVAIQVKEKFGTLRFYYDGGDQYVRGAVSMAEGLTERVCETCGNPGKICGGNWIRVTCDLHDKKNSQDQLRLPF